MTRCRVENLSDRPQILHRHFFYINTEFETGGAGIWKKKLNLGTPNVQSDGQDLEKEEDIEKRKCTNVLTAKEIEDAILASIKSSVQLAFEPYVEPYVKKSCPNKDIDNEDDTDNIEAAKQWAKNQKQSFS